MASPAVRCVPCWIRITANLCVRPAACTLGSGYGAHGSVRKFGSGVFWSVGSMAREEPAVTLKAVLGEQASMNRPG